jgi:hypothetical protein
LFNNVAFYVPLKVFLTHYSDGESGCGKSLTLAHLLHYGFASGFLLVHVPWGE